MPQYAIIIEWHGPYTREVAIEEAKNYWHDGLYMVFGRLANQKYSNLQYIGIAELGNAAPLASRIQPPHQHLDRLTQECVMYLGDIVTPRWAGRPKKDKNNKRGENRHSEQMLLAEKMLIFHLEPKLNDKCQQYAPNASVLLCNRFRRGDDWSLWNQTPDYANVIPTIIEQIDEDGVMYYRYHFGTVRWSRFD